MTPIDDNNMLSILLKKGKKGQVNDKNGLICGIWTRYESTIIEDYFVIITKDLNTSSLSVDIWHGINSLSKGKVRSFENILNMLKEVNYSPAIVKLRNKNIDDILNRIK